MIDVLRLLVPTRGPQERALAAFRPAIPLDRTLLCLDCDSVYALGPFACPACGSDSALPLGRVLGREPTSATARRRLGRSGWPGWRTAHGLDRAA